MYFKLAMNNVKKSIKDYLVYFMTLSFSICIFYIFNAIDSQEAMIELNSSQKEIVQLMVEVMGYVSVFISIVLGFLMVYANKFLIKRRKKELGLYLTLGMNKGTVSRILILETLIIGVFSLVTGLIVGIFASQALSVVTANLFRANLKKFEFTFSQAAFSKSILYFSIIYLVIMIFNTTTVSRCKLIELLNAGKKNEKFQVRKVSVSIVLFIISAVIIGMAYKIILKNGLFIWSQDILIAIVLGLIGTVMFFMSLSGIILCLVERNKKLYFKGLNIFVLRQINHKINTTFTSVSVVCIMLFLTICGLCCGFSLSSIFNEKLKHCTPFDATIQNTQMEAITEKGLKAELIEDGFPLETLAKDVIELTTYQTEVSWEDVVISIDDIEIAKAWEEIRRSPFPVMSLSDYNEVLRMQGEKPLSLKENEFVISCDFAQMMPYYEQFLKEKGQVRLEGRNLIAAQLEVVSFPIETAPMSINLGTLIVPDDLLNAATPIEQRLNINFTINDEAHLKQFNQAFYNIYNGREDTPYTYHITKLEVFDQNTGLSAIITYLAVYIGLVFLMASAAILALQQLSEASDNSERYELLRKLGTKETMIGKALLLQIAIYFIMPLGLAIIHSVVGLKVGIGIVRIIGIGDITKNVWLTGVIMFVVYGGYFLATYLTSKSVIRYRK